MDDAAKEKQIPVGLIVAGEVLFVLAGLHLVGLAHVGLLMAYVGVATVVGVGLMVAAAFITANLLKVSFGTLSSAVLKLAGIYLFANGAGALIGGSIGGLVASVLFFALIIWLFELEVPYAFAFCVINWVVQFVAGLLLAGMVAGMLA